MTNSWMNEDGEPIMDGAAWRFEQQLDADYQPDPDDYMGYNDEPDECEEDHECESCDGPNYAQGRGWECSYCGRECPIETHDQTPAEW